MKTAVIATVVLTVLAGAAAAGMLTSTPTRTIKSMEREAPPAGTPLASAAPAPERSAAASERSAAAPGRSAPVPERSAAALPAPSTKSGPVETARAPVPLSISHKRPLPEKPIATDGKAGADATASAEPPAGQMSQQAAKSAVEADGYKGVQMLSQGSNGVWKATALRGKTRVVVNVDPSGNVFSE